MTKLYFANELEGNYPNERFLFFLVNLLKNVSDDDIPQKVNLPVFYVLILIVRLSLECKKSFFLD